MIGGGGAIKGVSKNNPSAGFFKCGFLHTAEIYERKFSSISVIQ
jgi:hypothetical protein